MENSAHKQISKMVIATALAFFSTIKIFNFQTSKCKPINEYLKTKFGMKINLMQLEI